MVDIAVNYSLERLIFSRPDGTYVGLVNGLPYHVIPGDKLWDVAVEMAEEMGDSLQPEPPPEPVSPLIRPLTARQFRLSLLRASITSSMVMAEIAKIVDPIEREEMTVEWEYATQYTRDNNFVQFIETNLLPSAEEMDDIWRNGLSI